MPVFKLSYGTNGYRNNSLEETIEKLSGLGYEGIDLMADRPHAYPPDLNSEERRVLRRTIKDLGLKIANINASSVSAIYKKDIEQLKGIGLPPILEQFYAMYEPSFVSQSEEARQKRIHYMKQCVDLAVDLGVGNISTFSGIRLPMSLPLEAWGWLVSGLKECLDYAGQRGIKIGLEPEPFHLIERIEDLTRLLKEIDSEWLGVNLDIGHSLCIEGSIESVCGAIKELKTRIIHLHIEDIKDKKHYHLIPGAGDIGEKGFKMVANSLKEIDYTGFLTVELYTYQSFPDSAAKQAIQYLKKAIG